MLNESNQRVGQIVTAQLPFRTVVDIFISLVRQNLELLERDVTAEIEELDRLRIRLADSEAGRNRLMHSIYGRDGEEGIVRVKYTATAKRGWNVTTEAITVNDVDTVTAEIRGLTADVPRFMTATFGSPTPPTSQPPAGA